MLREKLSEHFHLDEFLVSETAARHNISNQPTSRHRRNMVQRLVPGLEAARSLLGDRAIVVTSGYRNAAVNRLVGGVPTSAHSMGYAADVRVAGLAPIEVAHRLADSDLTFDQLILETGRNVVHLSFDPRQRMQLLTQAGGPGTPFAAGLPKREALSGGALADDPAPLARARIDRDYFRSNFPSAALFGAEVGNGARWQGFQAIFDVWDGDEAFDRLEWLAYALATAWHETGGRLQPVREGFAESDAIAFARVSEYCRKRGISNYAARHSNGQSYYGRGYVQLTHGANYRKAGERLGQGELYYQQPDLVMQPQVGAKILLHGMLDAWFRPSKGGFLDYFSADASRWVDARDMINGDKRHKPNWANGKTISALVAQYGRGFFGALRLQ